MKSYPYIFLDIHFSITRLSVCPLTNTFLFNHLIYGLKLTTSSTVFFLIFIHNIFLLNIVKNKRINHKCNEMGRLNSIIRLCHKTNRMSFLLLYIYTHFNSFTIKFYSCKNFNMKSTQYINKNYKFRKKRLKW